MAFTLKQTKPKQPYVKPTGLGNDLFDQLDALMQSEEYDDEFHVPTGSAFSRMRGFLEDASGHLKLVLPLGTMYADGDGGLRLEWIRPDRELRLIVSASPQGRSYLYHEQGDDYGADYALSGGEFGRWLNWLDSAAKVS